jgi:hypothetical protein
MDISGEEWERDGLANIFSTEESVSRSIRN